MHQQRPLPAHLAGQENIRFSINQILSPASEEANVEEEGGACPPYGNGGNFPSKPWHHTDILLGEQSYFCPKIENYFSEKWGVGPHSDQSRFPNSSFYHRSYERSSAYQPESLSGNLKNSPNASFSVNSPVPNQEAVRSHLLSSPGSTYVTRSDCQYRLTAGAESSESRDYSGAFTTYEGYNGYASSILSKTKSHTPCVLGASASSNTESLQSSQQLIDSSNRGLFAAPPRSTFLSGNFPWMESRRERIASKC